MSTLSKIKRVIISIFTEEMLKIFFTPILGILIIWSGSFFPILKEYINTSVSLSYLQISYIILFSTMLGGLIIYNILKYQIDRLKKLSNIDDLTGLFNSRELNIILHQQIQESRRYKKEFSVILIDIDNFKFINDNVSYAQGDSILKQFSNLMTNGALASDGTKKYNGFRSSDIVFRYKLGDEFLIILPNTRIKGAIEAAERLRQAVKQHDFDSSKPNTVIKITISCSVVGANYENDTVITILDHANRLLHKAKTKYGKNYISFDAPNEIIAKETRVSNSINRGIFGHQQQ